MSETWTVKSILDWCEGYLERKGDAQPRLSAQWLLGEAMGLSRIELYTNFDKPLTDDERATMREWVARRGEGEPLQLICGTAPFRHMVLDVASGVLIPRPETEVLVSEVLAQFPAPKQISAFAFEIDLPALDSEDAREGDLEGELEALQVDAADTTPEAIRVIDLCTGSGCIACALATEHPYMEVVAIDIAPAALELAARNAEKQGVSDRVQVIESDLLSVLVADKANHDAFDVIVSNPPYIPSAVMETLDAEVSNFEPALALDGGEDGLDLFRRFILDAYLLLKPNGLLAVELFEESLNEAQQIAEAAGFCNTRIVKDLTCADRILVCTK